MDTRFNLYRWTYALAVLALGTAVAGCSPDNRVTWTKSKDGYVLAVRTAPEPPQLGKTAIVTAVLHFSGHPDLASCPIQFRQYMPGRKMAGDDKSHAMRQALSSGIYSGESGVFSVPGDWVIEFDITCNKDKFTLTFPFHVKPPA